MRAMPRAGHQRGGTLHGGMPCMHVMDVNMVVHGGAGMVGGDTDTRTHAGFDAIALYKRAGEGAQAAPADGCPQPAPPIVSLLVVGGGDARGNGVRG